MTTGGPLKRNINDTGIRRHVYSALYHMTQKIICNDDGAMYQKLHGKDVV
jgi:hypothetical protein